MLQRQQTDTTLIHPLEIPTVGEASHRYRQQGGSLTEPHTFGQDPLAGDDDLLQQRDREFTQCLRNRLLSLQASTSHHWWTAARIWNFAFKILNNLVICPFVLFTYHPQPNLRIKNYYNFMLELFPFLLRTLYLLLNCGTVKTYKR